MLDVHEWAEGEWRRQRAEVMTLVPGTPCSPTDTAQPGLDPSEDWWQGLNEALRVLAATPTERVSIDQIKVDRRVQAAFGTDAETGIQRWETVHGDLHWANLLTPWPSWTGNYGAVALPVRTPPRSTATA
ncbi:hypothetical protein [Streptomyces sp. NBC_01508]|uniref:hypothetical protein n=1 Tax=Streptomyces sp. NBC_01508 TaxID=2903888 RepID=UPI003864C3D9